MPTWSRRRRARASSSSRPRSWPTTSTRPDVARSRPPATIIRLDFPAPDGPTTAVISPEAMSRVMPRRILTMPASLAMSRWTSAKRTIGCLLAAGCGTVTAMNLAFAYGRFAALVNSLLLVVLLASGPANAQSAPVRIAVLGDSLAAGYGVKPEQSFPARLEAALKAQGRSVTVLNQGVSGDTTAGGLDRLDWLLADKPDIVLVELGGNDALRGLDPAVTGKNLSAIVEKLQAAHVKVWLAGMMAPRNLGSD